MSPLPEAITIAQIKLLLIFAVPEIRIAVVVIVKHPGPEHGNISSRLHLSGRVKNVHGRTQTARFISTTGRKILEPGVRNLYLSARFTLGYAALGNRKIVLKAFERSIVFPFQFR